MFGLSSLQADSKVKFAAWPTSWRPPGADRLSSRWTKVNSRIRLAPYRQHYRYRIIIIIIACRSDNLPFNHRRSSFSGRCVPTWLWNTVPQNFPFEGVSLQSFFLQIPVVLVTVNSGTIINLLLTFILGHCRRFNSSLWTVKCDPEKSCSHTFASVTKQYNSVPV